MDAENLGAFRNLRARLARLAARYPHLVSPSGDSEAGGWVSTLREAGVSTGTKAVGFRLAVELYDRIDEHVSKVRMATGAAYSRTDAVSALLTLGLDLVDQVEDEDLPGGPETIRDLVALALEGVREARQEVAHVE